MDSYGAGGGFMRGTQGSQGTPGEGRSRGSSALRPVTIHQVLTASQAHPDAELYIDGKEVKEISLVACIRNVNATSTHLGYLVEDGTGQIDVRRWIDANVEEAQKEFEINTYVRIIGSIKVFNSKRSVHCSRMRAVEDMNEVLFHSVECVYTSLYTTKGPPGNGMTGINNQAGGQDSDMNNPYGAAGGGGEGGPDLFADLSAVQKQLMKWILEHKTEDGVNINHIAKSAGVPQAKEKLTQMIDDGHLYTTIDEEHVLPTSS